MTLTGPILCLACTRLHHDSPAVETCDAFPAGIPQAILDGGDHRKPRGGEVGGEVFEAAETPGAEVALDAWMAVSR